MKCHEMQGGWLARSAREPPTAYGSGRSSARCAPAAAGRVTTGQQGGIWRGAAAHHRPHPPAVARQQFWWPTPAAHPRLDTSTHQHSCPCSPLSPHQLVGGGSHNSRPHTDSGNSARCQHNSCTVLTSWLAVGRAAGSSSMQRLIRSTTPCSQVKRQQPSAVCAACSDTSAASGGTCFARCCPQAAARWPGLPCWAAVHRQHLSRSCMLCRGCGCGSGCAPGGTRPALRAAPCGRAGGRLPSQFPTGARLRGRAARQEGVGGTPAQQQLVLGRGRRACWPCVHAPGLKRVKRCEAMLRTALNTLPLHTE